MRVLHLTRGFADYVVELLNGMPEEVQNCVAIADADIQMAKELKSSVSVFYSRAPAVREFGNVGAMFRLVKLIRKIRPDIMHLQSGVLWELVLTLLFPKIKVVVTVHDVLAHPSRRRRFALAQLMTWLATRTADLIIVHGHSLRDLAREKFGQERRIAVIPHGIISRYGVYSGEKIRSDARRVLFFGTVDEWKGIEYLIDCEPLVRERIPDVQFKIAGGCADPAYYRTLLRPGQRITMELTRQSTMQVRSLFDWADILVLPYVEASQSGVLQIAVARAVPVIVTSVGALTEVVDNGAGGLVVPPRNASALADAVCKLLLDVELRAHCQEQLVNLSAGRFNWSRIGLETVRHYQSL